MQLSFIAAMKQFFRLKPEQTTMEFGREVLKLSYDERLEFHAMLKGAGIDCAAPIQVGGAS